MADAKGSTTTTTTQTKADLAQLAADVQKAQNMMNAFALEAEKTGSKQAAAAKSMAAVYEKIAKEQARLLDLVEEHNELIDEQIKKQIEIQKLEKEGNEAALDAAKKEERSLKEKIRLNKETVDLVQKELMTVKQTARELTGQVGIWEKMGKSIAKGRAELVQYMLSSERLTEGVKGLFKATRDAADIQIMSGMYKGMTGDLGADLVTGTKLAMDYGSKLTIATAKLSMLGISAEETSTSFKAFSTISNNSSERMEKMTSVAGALSKVLGVSMPEATNYIMEQQLKYNRTAEQSAAVLFNVYENTKKYNEAAGTQVMRAGDVTKVLFDLSRESQMVVQEQQAMEKMITGNLLKLQAQGMNYQEALAGASTFIKKMTTEAPDWAKILAGRDLVNEIEKATQKTGDRMGDLTAEMREQLDKAAPGLAKRVEDINKKMAAGKMTRYAAERQIQELLQGTEVGMQAMNRQVQKIIKEAGPNAAQAIKQIYGVSDVEAQRIIDQSESLNQLAEDAKNIVDPAKSKEVVDRMKLSAKEVAMLQDESMDEGKRKSFLQLKTNQLATEEIKQQKEYQEKIREDNIKAAQEQVAMLKERGADGGLIKAAEAKVIELQGKPMEDVTEQISKEQMVMQGFLGGNFINTLMNSLNTPFGQIVTGIAGLASGFVDKALTIRQTSLLESIAKNLEGKGGVGGGSEGTKATASILEKGFSNLSKKFPKLGSLASKVSKTGLLKKLPMAGTAIAGATGLYEAYKAYKESGDIKDALAETIPAITGGIGAAVGTLGGPLGTMAGSYVGEYAGEALKDYLKKPKEEMVAKAETSKEKTETPKVVTIKAEKPPGITIPKITAEDIYKQPPMPSSIAATPVSPAPLPKAAEATTAAFTATPTTPTATGVTQTASLAPGAQGTDVILQTRLPIAQAVAANLMTMSQFGIARG